MQQLVKLIKCTQQLGLIRRRQSIKMIFRYQCNIPVQNSPEMLLQRYWSILYGYVIMLILNIFQQHCSNIVMLLLLESILWI